MHREMQSNHNHNYFPVNVISHNKVKVEKNSLIFIF